jgi:hypothetical protein
LQGYIRWDPFVLSLDMSPLGLCRQIKCGFLLNCLSVLYLSFRFLQHTFYIQFHYHHHHFRCRFCIRARAIWLFELSLSHSIWWFPFHPFSCKRHNFILLYGWIILHCVYIHYIFFIHSLVIGHLWFHSLAIMNSAVVRDLFENLKFLPRKSTHFALYLGSSRTSEIYVFIENSMFLCI